MAEKRARRTYSEEQKKQLVALLKHGKPRGEIVQTYDLTVNVGDKISATPPPPNTQN